MKRTIGLSLLALTIVGIFVMAYWMWIKATVVADPLHHERHMLD